MDSHKLSITQWMKKGQQLLVKSFTLNHLLCLVLRCEPKETKEFTQPTAFYHANGYWDKDGYLTRLGIHAGTGHREGRLWHVDEGENCHAALARIPYAVWTLPHPALHC